jgi:hypothetical protein
VLEKGTNELTEIRAFLSFYQKQLLFGCKLEKDAIIMITETI